MGGPATQCREHSEGTCRSKLRARIIATRTSTPSESFSLKVVSWEQWVTLGGALMGLSGAGFAVIGFNRTLRQFAPTRSLWHELATLVPAPVRTSIRSIRRIALQCGKRAKRILWRRPETHSMSATLTAESMLSASVGIQTVPAPFPVGKPSRDVTRELWERVNGLLVSFNDHTQDQSQTIEVLRSGHTTEIARLDRSVVSVAVDGIALQVLGLLLVTFGALLTAIPSLTSFGNDSSPPAVRPHTVISPSADHR